MINFEGQRYCSIQEYNDHINNRLLPQELVVDEHYLLMGALKAPTPNNELAFAAPLSVLKPPKIHRKNNLFIVNFALLDDDLQPEANVSIQLVHDGMMAKDGRFRKQYPHVKDGYLRKYNDGIDDDLKCLYDEINLVFA